MSDIFLVLVFFLLLAVVLRMDWVYYLVYVVGGVWVFSHWWIRRSLKQVVIERHLPSQVFSGEDVEGRVTLTNLSWLPVPWVRIQEGVPMELRSHHSYHTIATVGSRGRASYRYELRCRQRGYYHVGPLVLRTGDLFGFAESGVQEERSHTVIVYPRILSLEQLGLSSRSPFGGLSSRQRIFADPARMAGVRPYVNGDSLRHIHWKASAHEDALLTKKFDPAIALDVMVVLNLDRSAYPTRSLVGDSEWAIVATASVTAHISEQRQSVGLVCNGLDPLSAEAAQGMPARTGKEHLMQMLGLLARIQAYESESQEEAWLSRNLVGASWGTTIIYITPRLTEAALWTLHGFYRRGMNVMVLVCARQENFQQMQAQSGSLGVQLYRTLWGVDLQHLGDTPQRRRTFQP